jgi:hypothetical protein
MHSYQKFIYQKELSKILEMVDSINENYKVGDEIEWDIESENTTVDKSVIKKYFDSLPNKWKIFINKIKKFILRNKEIIKDNPIDFLKKTSIKISVLKNTKLRYVLLYVIIGIIVFSNVVSVDVIGSGENEFDRTIRNFIERIERVPINKIDMDKNLSIEDRGIDAFLNKLAYKESSNNWKSIRYYTKNGKKYPGYVGKYQFGNTAFKDIKSDIRVDDFHKNPKIWSENQQDADIIKLLKNNKHYLRGYYKYIGETIKGIQITESGLLASSHLVGNKSVKKFLSSGGKIDPKDANGVKCSDYMKAFSGYYLSI